MSYPWQDDPAAFLRQILGTDKFKITSGPRSPGLNAAIGGAPNSEHLSGNALDWVPTGGANLQGQMAAAAQSGTPFDQLIAEGNGSGHIGFAPGSNRNEVFGRTGGAAPAMQVAQGQMQGSPSGDPVDAMFAAAARSHSNALPQQPADPTDAMFMAAAQSHDHPQPSQQQPQGQAAPSPNMLADMVRAVPGGLTQGAAAIAGIPGDIRQGVQALGDYATSQIDPGFAKFAQQNRANLSQYELPAPPSSGAISNAISSPFGGYYAPQTAAGRYAQTAASFAPMAAGGEGSVLARLASRVVAPAVGSETAGEIAQGTPYEGMARVGGAVLGGLPVLGRSSGRALAAALAQPLPQDTADLISSYENMGGALRPGQYNPSRVMRAGDTVLADLPFSRAAGFTAGDLTKTTPAAQADQYNNLLAKTIGEDATRLTPDVLERAQSRIGNTINTVVGRNSVTEDEPLLQSFVGLSDKLDAVRPALAPDDAARIENTLNNLSTLTGKGLDGKVYQSMRQRGGLLDGLAGDSNPTVAAFGGNIRNALDDAFARQASPDDSAAILGARQQYRALKTLEPIAAKSATGDLSGNGASLLGRVFNEYGNPNNAGDLGTLARVGKAFIVPAKSSGTAENSLVYNLIRHPLKAAEQVAGTAIGAPVMASGRRILNNIINSPIARQRALGQFLQNGSQTSGPANAAMLGMLLRQGQQQ